MARKRETSPFQRALDRVFAHSEVAWLTAVCVVALIAAWPDISQPGLLNTRGGGDSPFLLQRLQQLVTALQDGHFPVRWMPDANYGYGYPFYNFYAPLSIYITAVFHFIGFSFVRSIHLSQLAGFIVAGLGMFALGRRWLGSAWAGWLTAVAYTVAPFHMVNVYVRGDSLAEFWAMAFYPLVILSADRLLTAPQRRLQHVAAFALAYAALILSHNISAMIFSPFLLLLIGLRGIQQRPFSRRQAGQLAYVGVGGLLALGLAAWFFVPALAEQSLAQLSTVTEGYFHFSNHFLGGSDQPLLQRTFFVNYSVNGREAFRMGLLQTVALMAGLLALLLTWRRQSQRPAALPFILLTLLISTVMLTPASRWLWQHVPLLSYTQFPWRFLSVQAFAAALATGGLALLPWRQWLAPGTAVLLLVAALGQLKTDHLILTDDDVTAERLAQYEWFTGNIGTTVSFEYLPPTVTPRPYTSSWLESGERWPLKALSGALVSAQLSRQRTTQQVWHVATAAPSTLLFPTLAWPGWRAWIDGTAAPIQPADGSGLITVAVPTGSHTVVLRLTRTPVRLIAELVSLTAVLVLLLLLGITLRQARPRWQPGLAGLMGVVLLSLLVRVWPQPASTAHNLTWDFTEMGYLHHPQTAIRFSSGQQLSHYTIDRETAAPGETINITLCWQNWAPTTATVSLVTPASNWIPLADQPAPPLLATAAAAVDAGMTRLSLTIPENAPTGLVVPRLTLAGGEALTPAGAGRGDLFLQPLRIVGKADTAAASGYLAVRAVQVQARTPTVLDVELQWFTAQPLPTNYNVALRLTDAAGRFLALADYQPGYGFQPSTLWPAGEWVSDWLAFALPAGEFAAPYALVATLYDVRAPNTAVLTRRLGELAPADGRLQFQPTTPVFTLPQDMQPATATFGGQIALRGYTVAQTAEAVTLTLYWQALSSGQTDYTRFVHLVDPAAPGPPLVQSDSMPRLGSYPTSQWTAGEIVAETVTLPLADVPPGSYSVTTGFYQVLADGSLPRLTAVTADGQPLPGDQAVLPVVVTVGD